MRSTKLLIMIEVSLCVALAMVFAQFKLWQMPNGGSVTLQMVPIFVLALRRGGKASLTAGLVFGILRMMLSSHVYYPLQGLLDYPIAFALVGVSGFFVKSPKIGMGLGVTLRFIAHVVAGKVFFGHYAPEGMNQWWYTLTYNATHLIPEIILTLIVIGILMNRRDLFELQGQATKMG